MNRRAMLSAAVALFVASAGLLLVPSAASAAPADVAYVDPAFSSLMTGDDPPGPATSVGTDAFATIGEALVSVPGTIHVSAGTFVEQLVISYPVNIQGAGAGSTVIQAPPDVTTMTVSHNYVTVLAVGADGALTMSGVTVSGPFVNVPGGVAFATIGVYDGGVLALSDSEAIGAAESPLSGAQRGTGILIGTRAGEGAASTATATIDNVLVSGYQKTGILVRAGSEVAISDSWVRGAGDRCLISSNGIQFGGSGSIIDSRVTDNRYTEMPADPACSSATGQEAYGISLVETSGLVTVSGNQISGNEYGIRLAASGPGAPATVTGNSITGLNGTPVGPGAETSWGFVLDWSRGNAEISDNVVTLASYGLEEIQAGNAITSNSLRGNDVAAQFGAVPNRFAANVIVGNDVGVASSIPIPVLSAGPNWWGCNEGPNQPGCDTATGSYAEPDWLVLTLNLQVCTVQVGSAVPATVALTTTHDGATLADVSVPPTAVHLVGSEQLELDPATGTTSTGELPITLTGLEAGTGDGSATVDSETVNTPGTGPCEQLLVQATEPTASGSEAPMLAESGSEAPIRPLAGAATALLLGGLLLVSAKASRRRQVLAD